MLNSCFNPLHFKVGGISRMLHDTQFLIIMNTPRAGLFATLMQVLGELYYCKKNNIIPVVFFGNNWAYWSPGGYNGSTNGWEYYFLPVSKYSAAEITGLEDTFLESCTIIDFDSRQILGKRTWANLSEEESKNISLPKNVTVTNGWPDFHFGKKRILEERRTIAYELISENITVRPNIVKKVDDFYEQYFQGNEIIGVHMRGRHHNTEVEGWYDLAFANESYYMEEVDALLDNKPDALIFIATDTEVTLEKFKKRYTKRCLHYDAKRSSENATPHLEYGGPGVGEDVLIEALLLARTDFLIHGISNVAKGVLCFNPGLAHIDIYEKNEKELATILHKRRRENIFYQWWKDDED